MTLSILNFIMTQAEFELEWNAPEDYVVCHTSGSTGRPKEIRLKKDFMRASARRTIDFFALDEHSRLHTCLDFRYIASKMMTVRAEVAHCTLTSEPPSSDPLQDMAADERIDLVSVVPAQMGSVLDAAERRSGIRNFLIGGSSIPPLLRRRIALSGYKAWESYGMTETASHIALRPVEESGREPFHTLPGITVSLSAEGCLQIRLPGEEDEIVTTDLAEVISSTEFRLLGRADNCIISGGIKIIPEDLESMLGPFIGFDYCISSLPDEKWGERAVLVVATGESLLPESFLRKAITVRLNQFRKSLALGPKAPKEIVLLKDFPFTSTGKLDRKRLKEMI